MSLRSRAVLAVALTIGFYALALGLIAVLVRIMFIPNVPGRVLIFCLLGAGAIAVSIIPRPTRFTPPGPRLNPAGQARLFAELNSVARAVGEAMPEEVYITPEMNAGVFQRGRRRVMVLGLPLMQIMTVPQMRAVLAHEFGHYQGGDTKLGPLIYRMRETIERTLNTLSGQAALLGLLFLAYGRMFMRVTQAVSRRQELAADELAARTVGARPMIEGLRALARGSLAFDVYWRSEVVPLLEAGFQPPLADGFARFLAEPGVMNQIAQAAEQELAKPRRDAYDSHPPDAERIAALSALPSGPDGEDPAAAVTLLEGLEAIEPWILIGVVKPGVQLRRVSWAETGNAALIPGWRERVRRQAHLIGGYTVGWLPELLKYADRIGQAEAGAARQSVPADRARALGVGFAGAAFANALAQNGWTTESLPGRPPVMRRGEAALEPFSEVTKLARGEVDADTWQRRCWDLGIRDLSLMPA
ncbi:MAG TPA: M48 family metallopeptidase [Candidatus Dormibacteraeota bacterium]